MDMITDDGWNVGTRLTGDYSLGKLEARVGFITADHIMDNFSLRPLTSMAMMAAPFTAPSQSDDLSSSIGLTLPRDSDTFRTGLDFHWSRLDAFEKNLSDGTAQEDINNANRSRVGVYVEWQKNWNAQWTILAGLRSDTVWSDTENIGQFYPDSAADAAAFNSQPHEKTNVNLDAMALQPLHARQ